MKIRSVLKRIVSPFLKLISKYYLSKNRDYKYQDIELTVLKGVFHPGLFLSTKQLLILAESIELENRTILELGAGSGAISVFCASKGANVTASDINPIAIKNVKINADHNKVKVQTILSDLFLEIPKSTFDYIFINPPYYPKNPTTDAEHAWFCGESFEYFKNLFSQLQEYVNNDSRVFMILSEDCEIESIKSIAEEHNFNLELYKKKQIWFEWNYIFIVK